MLTINKDAQLDDLDVQEFSKVPKDFRVEGTAQRAGTELGLVRSHSLRPHESGRTEKIQNPGRVPDDPRPVWGHHVSDLE